MFETILVPVDGSEPSHNAIRVASDIARQYEAKLVLAHVLMRGASLEDISDTARNEGFLDAVAQDIVNDAVIPYAGTGLAEPVNVVSRETAEKVGDLILKHAEEEAKGLGAQNVQTEVLDGTAVDAILKLADSINAGLVVTGSRGFGDLKSLVLGSFSHKLVQESPCPCLVVR